MDQPKPNFIGTLRRLPLFTDLTESELALLAQNSTRVHFEKGAMIFGEGDLCRELLIVEDGAVKIVKSAANGRQQLLSVERRGSSLAEVAVFDGGRYPAAAEAESETVLLKIPSESFRKICLENPETALKVFKVLGRRLRHLVGLVEALSATTVRARLLWHLVRLAEETGRETSRGICFQLTENNQELATRLGTVRELVSRNLGRLHEEGLIEMNKRSVNVRDLSVLREEADRGN